jgi:alpha-ketoglutarate-dependent taurine dioxygenase
MNAFSHPEDISHTPEIESLEPFGVIVHSPGAPLSQLSTSWVNSLLLNEKLVVLRGFAPLTREGFLDYCLAFPQGKVLHWDSGPVMEMKVDPRPKNYLFSREAVPFHWDGAFHIVPTYLAFHCLQAPSGEGGETLFCDTERVWNDASASEKAKWEKVELTYETAKLAHYGGKVTVKMVDIHPFTGKPCLRFAEPVTTQLNPVRLTLNRGIDSTFLSHLQERIYSPQFCCAHRWENGDYLFADNHALIHGRRPFREHSPRHLRRIQIL